jgi:hypothetical protein
VVERVEQRLRPVVERVVVRQRDAVHAALGEQLGGSRRGAEEERLRRVRPARSAVGDAALEIQHEQVGLGGDGDDIRGERLLAARDRLADPAAEHRVAGERQPHDGLRRHGAANP